MPHTLLIKITLLDTIKALRNLVEKAKESQHREILFIESELYKNAYIHLEDYRFLLEEIQE